MFCLSRRTCYGNSRLLMPSASINVTTSPYPIFNSFATEVYEDRRYGLGTLDFWAWVKGNAGACRFMIRKPTWIGFSACPPRRCACIQLGTKGSVARDDTHRDSGFHINPLRRHGEGRRGGFLF